MSRFVISGTTCVTRIPGKDEIAEFFLHAPEVGYKAWGAAGPLFWTPGLVRWANIDLIKTCAAQAGLEICTEVYGPAFPNDSIAEALNAVSERVLLFDAAEKLGSPLVVITGRPRKENGLLPTIAGIKALLPLIERKSVKLALEPHFGSQIQSIEDYEAIFNQISSPQVGITLDSGHFQSAGVNWRSIIQQFPDRIYNFHVKDHVGTQSVPLGAGDINLRGYIEELDSIGYEGALAVEIEVADNENLKRYSAEAFVYLRKLVFDVTGQWPI
jgi:sugar phosphate isomerase/epimerase